MQATLETVQNQRNELRQQLKEEKVCFCVWGEEVVYPWLWDFVPLFHLSKAAPR